MLILSTELGKSMCRYNNGNVDREMLQNRIVNCVIPEISRRRNTGRTHRSPAEIMWEVHKEPLNKKVFEVNSRFSAERVANEGSFWVL